MKVKNIFQALIFGILVIGPGCKDYLDIVPDKIQELELLFERKEEAYTALATCYHYLPKYDALFSTYMMATDEITAPTAHNVQGINLMRGSQNTTDPILSLWSGYGATGAGVESFYRGIRDCNILIENIYNVRDMTDEEKDQWAAEAEFLKAYYHFMLVATYGPIPIVDVNLPISASVEEVRVKRNTVDECFAYIVNTIDLAMENLPPRVSSINELGRVDKIIAASLKSRVLLYAASPLFNGNSEYYSTFTDHEGQKLFNLNYDSEKWKLAADAAKEAIDLAESAGISLYEFTEELTNVDSTLIEQEEIQALYNYRYMFTDKWNSELVWGHSTPINGEWWSLQAGTLMKNPASSSNEAAWKWISPSLRMVELYYTKNGLPITDDSSFDYDQRYDIVPVPEEDKYHAQMGENTLKLHLQREPRFYASIAFDRGYNRTWGTKFNLKMRFGEIHGKQNESNDNLLTGYGLKKINHMDSQGDTYDKLVTYAWPMIRLAELYLNYAEAYNQYQGPDAEVYQALNKIRARSGVPSVEDAWSGPYASIPNKHLNKEGLAEIIQQERMIEMAFEGHRYFDVRRWKMAHNLFSTPIKGLSINQATEQYFYLITNVSQRSFISPRDYLQPIKLDEIIRNSNLVQNPGW
ncbi:MAG: RagB/SusD family nutrient uptake outer membrane protein [Bacteroidales bacterium]|nr:RagB/SusD family nutrient uptake outer membrane protein [Bacteroidales bacterium]MCF8454366.1 RagB/SusD family nutrient uptake outer membrane protein [Bacteroidales bacterium]